MFNKYFFFICLKNWTLQLHRLHQEMEHWHMTKYLSHYLPCLILKEYLHIETQGKVYAFVVFVPLQHSLSAVHFLNRRCTIKKLSVWTRGVKWKWRYLKMLMLCTVRSGMLYAKSHKNVTRYCWFKFMLSEYNYVHFTAGLMYWKWTARGSVDNHSNDNSTQRATVTYRCTMPSLWRCSTANYPFLNNAVSKILITLHKLL